MNTPTPETDAMREDARNVALEFDCKNPPPKEGDNCWVIGYEDVQRLERERDEALSKLESYSDAYAMLEMERDQLREELNRRDALYKGGVVVVSNEDYSQLCRERDQLANERDELKLKLAYLEADNQEHIKRDMHRTGEVEQLRKVADELANAIREGNNHGYGLRIGDTALAAYNELPHVKKS